MDASIMPTLHGFWIHVYENEIMVKGGFQTSYLLLPGSHGNEN